jgi:hypothetical protein
MSMLCYPLYCPAASSRSDAQKKFRYDLRQKNNGDDNEKKPHAPGSVIKL